jgi:hypothetical protein
MSMPPKGVVVGQHQSTGTLSIFGGTGVLTAIEATVPHGTPEGKTRKPPGKSEPAADASVPVNSISNAFDSQISSNHYPWSLRVKLNDCCSAQCCL